MRRQLRVLLFLATLLAAATACTKEEYTAKFGVLPTYTLHASDEQPPHIQGRQLVATVSYLSKCANGGSDFTVHHLDKGGMHVVIASRDEPVCDGPELLFEQLFTGEIRAPLTWTNLTGYTQSFIAFPPGGDYELYMLKSKTPAVSTGTDTEEEVVQEEGGVTQEEKDKVAKELATQNLEDSENHHAHCTANPGTGCCSEYMLEQLALKIAADKRVAGSSIVDTEESGAVLANESSEEGAVFGDSAPSGATFGAAAGLKAL